MILRANGSQRVRAFRAQVVALQSTKLKSDSTKPRRRTDALTPRNRNDVQSSVPVPDQHEHDPPSPKSTYRYRVRSQIRRAEFSRRAKQSHGNRRERSARKTSGSHTAGGVVQQTKFRSGRSPDHAVNPVADVRQQQAPRRRCPERWRKNHGRVRC